ncbi:hypothetical protein GCM10023080_065060 [Streptomyces pseudoechinosporeus]
MTAEAESTIAVVPRSGKKTPGRDKPTQPEDQAEAPATGPEGDDEGPDEGLCPAA